LGLLHGRQRAPSEACWRKLGGAAKTICGDGEQADCGG